MGLLLRKPKPVAETANNIPVSLVERAIASLQQAAQVQLENADLFVEERVTWQPDSWLLQRIWQALADGGAGSEALTVALLIEDRAPLARAQALYRVAQQVAALDISDTSARPNSANPNSINPNLINVVRRELQQARPTLFGPWNVGNEARQVERLLLYGASAAQVGELSLALACLERADQWDRVWDRVMVHAEQRGYLAQIVARVGLHPFTAQMIALAIRRYEDAGAHFVHQIMGLLGPRLAREQLPRRVARLLQRCVDTFQFATLATLNSRRLAAAVFGQAGMIQAVIDQVNTISNVQEARRDSGLSSGKGDPHFLRQVKRPSSNPDIDFQVYALQEAVRMMPVRAIGREERIDMADRLAALAIRSDGWTAAGAAASLVELGALKYAISVVDHIPPQDPTRSEGVISLVRALLEFGDPQLAEEQVNKALTWLKSLDRRNPERATIWGLAEVYLDHHQPEMALRLLEVRHAPPAWGERMRRALQNRINDDELRDNRLRFQALLQQTTTPVGSEMGSEPGSELGNDTGWSKELQTLYDQLRQWAGRLLDGEALIAFYVEGLLRPLFNAGRSDLVWLLLPQVRQALNASSGDKHTMQVQRVTTLLAERAAPHLAGSALVAATLSTSMSMPTSMSTSMPTTPNGADHTLDGDLLLPFADPSATYAALTQFLVQLWEADVQKGLWQTIHGIEGSLPLLLALEGPTALMIIAQMVLREGGQWLA